MKGKVRMFTNYMEDKYISGVKVQHNIMVFVGNGFDLAVLKKYRKDGLVSSYSKFYDYLSYKGISSNNVLYKKMTSDRDKGKKNWSDFEESIEGLIQEDTPAKALNEALKEVQKYFLLFLNELVVPEILLEENKEAEENKWGTTSLSKFLSDLNESNYKKIKFPTLTNHYHMFNFLFVNFNYTSLLDNYLYLDRGQFDPRPHKSVDTNFSFYPDPKIYGEPKWSSSTVWSSFVMTNIIHPHGYQNIPRSLLFGIEDEAYKSDREYQKFNKSYWAQNNLKYRSYFDDTRLFIIYGTSIGKTDSWWWENTLSSLINTESELIIYYYNDGNDLCDEEMVKEKFISVCDVDGKSSEELLKAKNKIYVVLFEDDSEKILFSLK